MSVVYSPLCDTDSSLYREYLQLLRECVQRCENVTAVVGTDAAGALAWSWDLRSVKSRCSGGGGSLDGGVRSVADGSEWDVGGDGRVASGVGAQAGEAVAGRSLAGARGGGVAVGLAGARDGVCVVDTGESRCGQQLGDDVGHTAAGVVREQGGGGVRGPNYERNRANREKQKARRKSRKMMASDSWRPESQATVRPESPPSLTGTVQTVTTEIAEELEAKRTLALRRAAENRVAEALANHKLQSMLDPDKTKAVANLDAARVEQRINEAKAKAQAAFLKCSDAVTSLGSAGSAGEYVLKKEVKKGQIYQKKYEDAHAQMQEMMKYLSNEAKAKMAQWPAVKVPTYGEMFGDCPAHFNDEQAEAYYRDLANLDEEHVFASEVLF